MLVQVCPKGDTSSQGKVIDYFRCYGNGTVWCFFLYKAFFFFAESAGSLYLSKKLVKYRIKQLLDEVLLTETLIISGITKTESNNCFIIHCIITTNRPSHGTQFDMHYACNLQIIFTNLLADN